MFQHLYSMQPGDSGGNYDLSVLTEQARWSIQKSRAENPNCTSYPAFGIDMSAKTERKTERNPFHYV